MRILKNLFVLVSRFYIKNFPKYQYWSTHAEMFLTVFIGLNIVSFLLIFDIRINSILFVSIGFILHFLIGYFFDKYDDKKYVLDYELNFKRKIISYMIIIGTLLLFVLALWFL